MFEWLESTAPAIWVGESLWGYPIMLGAHAIGLAIVVGIFVMLDLRLFSLSLGERLIVRHLHDYAADTLAKCLCKLLLGCLGVFYSIV